MGKKQWLVAVILTFITVCAWVIFDIVHTRSQVQISPKLQEVIEPISPVIDTKPIQTR